MRARRVLSRWGPTAAAACQAAAICDPARVAVLDEDRTLTFTELDERTSALAGALRARGYGPDDTLAVMCANHHWLLEAHIAASKVGMNLLYLDQRADASYARRVLRAHRPRLLICDERPFQALGAAPIACRRLLAARTPGTSSDTLEELIVQSAPAREDPPERRGRTVTLAVPTADGWRERSVPSSLLLPAAMSCSIPLRPRQTTMLCSPMSSAWGHLHLTLAMRLASTLILRRGFDALEVLATLEQHGVDAIVLDDEMLQAIVCLPRETLAWYPLGALRVIALRERRLSEQIAIPAISRFKASLYSRTGPAIVTLGATVSGGEVPAAA